MYDLFNSRLGVYDGILCDKKTYRLPKYHQELWGIIQDISNEDFHRPENIRILLEWIEILRSAIPDSRHKRRFLSWFTELLPNLPKVHVISDSEPWNNLEECPISMRKLSSNSFVLGCRQCRNAYDGYALWRWVVEKPLPKCPLCRSDIDSTKICEIVK